MTFRRVVTWLFGTLVLLALSLGVALQPRAAPLEAPPAVKLTWPRSSPPAGMSIRRLSTGSIHRVAAFAYSSGSFRDSREFSMACALVSHPRGDLLIDAGFSRNIDAHFRLMPAWFRALTSYSRLQPAADQLATRGYDPRRLAAILLTHAHWDHVSGASDFPETPVWVTTEELRFISDGGWITGVARELDLSRYRTYGFNDGPYLGYPLSHDVFGDGSVMVVPAPGHTPGSVHVFVSLPEGNRYLFVGDTVWQREGFQLREQRPWWTRFSADADARGVRAHILHLWSLSRAFPQLTIVPAHDARAFATLPAL